MFLFFAAELPGWEEVKKSMRHSGMQGTCTYISGSALALNMRLFASPIYSLFSVFVDEYIPGLSSFLSSSSLSHPITQGRLPSVGDSFILILILLHSHEFPSSFDIYRATQTPDREIFHWNKHPACIHLSSSASVWQ